MLTQPHDVIPARNPNLSPIEHVYLVEDEQGRKGIAYLDVVYHGTDVLFVRPSDVPSEMDEPSNLALPSNAIIMTKTAWHLRPDGSYKGLWYDSPLVGHVREDELHTLRLISDAIDSPAAALGRKGGSATSAAKTAANRAESKSNKPPKPGSRPRGRPKQERNEP